VVHALIVVQEMKLLWYSTGLVLAGGLLFIISNRCQSVDTITPDMTSQMNKLQDDSGIAIRIYARLPVALAFEWEHTCIIRIENRSNMEYPLLSQPPDDDSIQFQTQTFEQAQKGEEPDLNEWSKIIDQAELYLKPGQAVEMTGTRVGTQLSQNGLSRVVLQTGEDSVIYSNWVDLKFEPCSTMLPIATLQLKPSSMSTTEFLTVTTPSGKWLCCRSLYQGRQLIGGLEVAQPRLTTLCLMPKGDIPDITPDIERRQAAISFPDHATPTIYYNALFGLCRSNPWPVGHSGVDFILKPMPIDADSPLEFPESLFQN
jgi:hypothetical protein